MRRNLLSFICITVIASGLYAQISNYSISASPRSPNNTDLIEITLINSNHNCCVNYDSQSVLVEGADIYLFYSASNVINPCMCPGPGFSYYDTGPLEAGRYDVYAVEAGIHCPPGEFCIGTMPAPEKVGELTVLKGEGTEDTYLIDRLFTECKQEPCRYFTVHDITAADSFTVAGVIDINGEYVCLFCYIYIPWIDGDVQVKGYFKRDSLDGWAYSDAVFQVTEVLAEVPVQDIGKNNFFPENPFSFSFNSAGDEVTIRFKHHQPVQGRLVIYNPEGKTVYQAGLPASGDFTWKVSGMPAGVYTVQWKAENKTFSRKLFLK